MLLTIIISFFLSILIADNNSYCNFLDSPIQNSSRTYYNIGDTISEEDQASLYNVCHSDGNYDVGASFKLADYTNDIILISMNATW
tara:strand:+ start:519 stop:776 length:258 start_codon:yes stop_codon:yes gene_type:complete